MAPSHVCYYSSSGAQTKAQTRGTFQNADKDRRWLEIIHHWSHNKKLPQNSSALYRRQNPVKYIFNIHLGMGIIKPLLLFSAGKINFMV